MKSQTKATLLDVIVDGFEGFQGCMESVGGWRQRQLPMPTEQEAMAKYVEFVFEAARWKGSAKWDTDTEDRKIAKWPDLQIRWEGRGVLVLVPDPRFDSWWHQAATWEGDPMDAVTQTFYGEEG